MHNLPTADLFPKYNGMVPLLKFVGGFLRLQEACYIQCFDVASNILKLNAKEQ